MPNRNGSKKRSKREKENDAVVGLNIRMFRRRAHMSQDCLGFESGAKHNTISNYEAGRQSVPVNRLIEFARALGVEIEDLLNGIK